MDLLSSYEKIKDRIQNTCEKTKRQPQSLCLIAVSKKQSPEKILKLAQAGHRDFGENYVQEWQKKVLWLQEHDPLLASKIRWHFLGPLQSNKVKYIADQITYLHTLDSLKLAEKLSQKIKKTQKILIQIKLGEEDSKSGIQAEEALPLIQKIENLPNLKITGLMSLPKPGPTKETRTYFKQLKSLLDEIRPKLQSPEDFQE
ncbi:MAG: YggS family pyridoxal phosphate-dependent enzyme, partial [Deltaproteobacteria bacterium]|nr:YggS family pyridoxal phosphate-dependent enzyme [Deltaproteobacteria bacterium]